MKLPSRQKRKRSDSSDAKSVADAKPASQAGSDSGQEIESAPWRALFFFVTKSNVPLLIAAILFSSIAGAVEPAKAFIIGRVFDGFVSFASGALEKDDFFRQEKNNILYLLAIAGGGWLFHFLELSSWLAFGELQARNARDRLFHGLLKREIEWYDLRKNGIGALLPRIQAQIRELQLATSQPLGFTFNLVATSILSLTQALVYSWDLTLVSIASTPLIIGIVLWVGRRVQVNYQKQQDKLTQAQKFSSSAFSAIETVKCFNGQEVEQEKYNKYVTEAATFYYWVTSASAIQSGLLVLLSVSMFVQGFYYGGILIGEGKNSVADVMTTFLSAVTAFQSINGIIPQLLFLEKGRIAGATLRAIMSQVQDGSDKPANQGQIIPRACHGNIDVRNLSFAYPSLPQQLALDDVTMYIQGGDITFLIGKSGSGKSTLGQLLLRFYSSYEGSLCLDGVPLNSLDLHWLRSNVTLVEQTSLLFNDTLFRNIAFGRKDYSQVSKEEVMEAAEFALLTLMINDLPKGLETMVGYKGGTMSGGQRQRMALARARLRDTPILVLDESTSALDHINRALMMEAVRRWRRGKTTIIITHDIAQILPDDYVYVLAQGRLVQEGYRKQMERMVDTPFQGFLPPDQRAVEYSHGARKGTGFESIRTRGSSLDSFDYRQSFASQDPLESHLEVSENKRQSNILSTFNEGNLFAPMRTRALPAPWMRFAGPGTNSSGGVRWSGFWANNEEKEFQPAKPADTRPISKVMEDLVNQTGRLAAESRLTGPAAGRKRRPIIEHDSASNFGEGETSHPKCDDSVDEEGEPVVKQRPFKQILTTIWPILDRQTKFVLIVAIWGTTIHALSSPIFSYVLSRLLKTYSIPGGDRSKALTFSMAILGLAIVDAIHTYIYRFGMEYTGQRWVDNYRAQAIQRILGQPRAFFDKEENAVSRLTGSLDQNAEEMRNLLGRFAAVLYMAFIMVVVAIGWAMISQWKMTLISIAAAPYIYAVTKAYASISDRWETASSTAAEDAASIFTETFANIKTVRALTLEKHFIDKYIAATNTALRVGFRRALFAGFFYGLSDSAGNFATAMVFYVGALLVNQGASVDDVVQVFVMLVFTIANVGLVLDSIPQIGASKDAASRLLRLAELPEDSHEHLGDTRITTVGDIVFEDLKFAYPSRPGLTVLNDVNLHIEPGTTTAIVGGSGSGKSTIANLLLNLYSTDTAPGDEYRPAGDLSLAGRDIKRIHTPSLRSLVVPVSQTPTLFSATVAENIGYGVTSDDSLHAIQEAARQAGIHDFIISLPQGYDTAIGDGGLGLSGGQAQRIAIARALMRQPAVLILDEATSALDVESANLVRATVADLVGRSAGGMTVIIITHARDMMEVADRIVVMDQGRIVEEGEMQELLGRKGVLANLLNGGQWGDAAEQGQQQVGRRPRPRGIPFMREVDWRKGRRGPGRR